jgi:metal-dependent amidase/aminoacylase/carboxypeptidase family protein
MMYIAAFIGVAEVLKKQQKSTGQVVLGRVRLIGTPAEEGFGGRYQSLRPAPTKLLMLA